MPDELVWYQQQRSSDEGVYLMCMHYREHRVALEGKAVVTCVKWTVMLCKEFIKAESGVSMLAKGELMCERRFMVWATDRFLSPMSLVLSFFFSFCLYVALYFFLCVLAVFLLFMFALSLVRSVRYDLCYCVFVFA